MNDENQIQEEKPSVWKTIGKWVGIVAAAIGFVFVVGFRVFMGVKKEKESE